MWGKVLIFMEQFRNNTIYIGCSGGIDSMVLTHFLHENLFKIHVLHVNYHKRGAESDHDMQLVRAFCEERNIPYSIKHFKNKEKGNFQENARKFRYHFFEEMASQSNDIIVLGHHADDQTETFFMNLTRQSGILGLACMPAIRKQYVRPFLHLSKQDLYGYAQKHKVKWREDKSNQSADYLRNKWRLEFIPQMKKVVPELQQATEILVNAFQETQRELEIKIEPVSKSILESNCMAKELYNSLSSPELFELWRQLNQPSNTFPRFLELNDYSKGKHIEAQSPFIRIINEGAYFSFLEKEDKQNLPGLKITPVASLPESFSKSVIYLNPDKLTGTLKIRKWQQGDKISPVGIKGTQPVSQIIKDAKIPHIRRNDILVVCDEKNIHWVVNLKIGKTAISHTGDQQILKVEIQSARTV